MHFNGQNRKKVQKADPNYFLILHENMSPDFFWGPPLFVVVWAFGPELHVSCVLTPTQILYTLAQSVENSSANIMQCLDSENESYLDWIL